MYFNKPTAPVTNAGSNPRPQSTPPERPTPRKRATYYLVILILLLLVAPFIYAVTWLKDQLFNLFGKVVAPLWDNVGLAIYHHFGIGGLVICLLVLLGIVEYSAIKDSWPKRRGGR